MRGTEELTDMLASHQGDRPAVKDGYVDVLGDKELKWGHKSHRLFNKSLFPRVYERFWRPVVARSFLGLTGPRHRKERELTLGMLGVSRGSG